MKLPPPRRQSQQRPLAPAPANDDERSNGGEKEEGGPPLFLQYLVNEGVGGVNEEASELSDPSQFAPFRKSPPSSRKAEQTQQKQIWTGGLR
mmetsp:Transcript_38144/g.92017  ORF Transcript_38144/g.92017 Transcript_38144/m.92017 type:complete len:92 (-) Transcript_38144:223-498(-)